VGHRSQVAGPVRVGQDVDAPEEVLVADGVRRRVDLDGGDVGQPHALARRRVDAEVRMSSRLWRASGMLQTWTSYALPARKMSATSSPAISVDAARTHVARLQPVPFGRLEVDLDRHWAPR
jgi:hypothetical protein